MKLNQLKVGVIISYLSIIVSYVVTILYTPFMLKHLGQSEYGIYTLVGSLIGSLGLLELGFGNSIVRYIAKYRAENDKIKESNLITLCLRIYFVVGIISLFIGFIIYFNITKIFSEGLTSNEIDKAKIIFIIMMVNLALSFPFSIFRSVMTGYEKFVIPTIVNLIRGLIIPCIMVPLLLLGYKSISIVILHTLFNIISAVINIWYVLVKLKVKIRMYSYDIIFVKELFKYSFYIFIIAIVNQICWNTDQIILGMVANSTAISIYAVGGQISGFYMALSSSISVFFLPRVTKMVTNHADKKELSDLFIRIARLQFIVLGLFLSGFFLFGKEFIVLWVGEKYYDAWLIAIILMGANTIPLIQQVGVSILQANNMHGFRSIMYLIIAIANIFISIPLASKYGGVGSAIGTALALIAGNIIGINIYYFNKLRLNIPRFFYEIILELLPSMVLAVLLGKFLNMIPLHSWYGIIFKSISFCLIYCFALWLRGLNKYEKKLILFPLFQIINRRVNKSET